MAIYNNPAIGQAFQNLAGAFAPPSGSDLSGYANAAATRQQAERLAQLFSDPNLPEWDKRAIASGLYNPTQSFYAQDQNNATTQRGQDIGHSSALGVANINNAGALARQMAEPILVNENQTAILPQQTQEATGLTDVIMGQSSVGEDETILRPDGTVVEGMRSPLSETEFLAGVLSGMDPSLQEAAAFGNTPIESVIMDGAPQYATRPQAIGQTPAPTGAEGARKDAVAVLPGQSNPVPVTRAPSDMVWRTADGQPIPDNAQVFSLPAPTGTAEETGLTPSTASGVQGRLIATQQTIDTAGRLLDTIRANPSSQGIAGMLRGTAQDVIATGGELGQMLGGGVAEVSSAVNNGLVDAGLADFFDPSIPAIEMLTNLLAWQYAKSMSGERVSNEQFRVAQQSVGGSGAFANQQSSEARLTTLIDMLTSEQATLQRLMPGFNSGADPSGGPSAGPTPPAPPQPPQPPAPPTGGQSQMPTYEQYDALPSGARYTDPDGNIREKS